MTFNHNRLLSDFYNTIDKLKVNGYNPIAVSQIYFEDVFVFVTNQEAEKAYHQFERDKDEKFIGEIIGWWYGKDDFIKLIKEYESHFNINSKVLVYWLIN